MTEWTDNNEKRAPSIEEGNRQDYSGKDILPPTEASWSRELVKQIAEDVGEAVIFHIETMYPAAVAAAPSTFPRSVKNTVYNQIMSAIEISDAGQVAARLAGRKRTRRKLRTAYQNMRASGSGGQAE
jgi:hypothetical protein